MRAGVGVCFECSSHHLEIGSCVGHLHHLHIYSTAGVKITMQLLNFVYDKFLHARAESNFFPFIFYFSADGPDAVINSS